MVRKGALSRPAQKSWVGESDELHVKSTEVRVLVGILLISWFAIVGIVLRLWRRQLIWKSSRVAGEEASARRLKIRTVEEGTDAVKSFANAVILRCGIVMDMLESPIGVGPSHIVAGWWSDLFRLFVSVSLLSHISP